MMCSRRAPGVLGTGKRVQHECAMLPVAAACLLVLLHDRLVDHTEGAVPADALILEDPLRGVVRVVRARGGRLG